MQLARNLRNNLLAGLLVTAPLGVSIYVFSKLFENVDAIFGPALNDLLSYTFPALAHRRIPGLGIAAAVLILYATGSLTRSYIGSRMLRVWEGFIEKVPVFGAINTAIKQLIGALAPSQQGFKRVVLVHLADPESYVIGFVTGSTVLKDGEERKNVFIPTAPNPTTGVLVLLRPEQLVESDLTVEEAMKLVVSAGLVEAPGGKRAGSREGGGLEKQTM